MEILEAIKSRRSVRAFKPDPVPRKVLEELLGACRWTPSSSNSQPWEFAILGGKVMEDISTYLVEKLKTSWDRANLTFVDIHPDMPYPPFPEPYLSRARKVRAAIDSYQFPPGTPGLEEKRASYLHYGGRFYGAPNAIIVYTEKAFGMKGVIDLGMLIQSIVLGALAYRLGTCIMGVPTFWPEILRETLGIPESKLIALAVAIGYPDTKAPVNNFERTREPLDAFAHWYGV